MSGGAIESVRMFVSQFTLSQLPSWLGTLAMNSALSLTSSV